MNAIDLIKAAPKRIVRIGNTMHVHIGAEVNQALETKIALALAKGKTVTEDGVRRWVDESPVFDSTKSGSAAYTWQGDKIKVERTLVTKARNGSITRQALGTAWRNWE